MREVQAFEDWIRMVCERWVLPALRLASREGSVGVPIATIGDLMKVKFNARSLAEHALVWLEREGLIDVHRDTETVYLREKEKK